MFYTKNMENKNYERIFNMPFAGVYPHYIAKAEKKRLKTAKEG